MPAEDLELQRALALRAVTGGLLRLRWLAAATRCELAMHRHMRALKYGYNPDQPRVPKHEDGAGQWTLTDANGNPVTQRRVRVAGDVPTNDPPEVPKERPPTSRERSAALIAAARLLGPAATMAEIAELAPWLVYRAPELMSYNDPPKTLDELQNAASDPRPGYQIHHIVEQTQAALEGYPPEAIDAPENLVRIPKIKHEQINGWYQTKNNDFGGEAPRDYLAGRSWAVKQSVGLEALKLFGVLKP